MNFPYKGLLKIIIIVQKYKDNSMKFPSNFLY